MKEKKGKFLHIFSHLVDRKTMKRKENIYFFTCLFMYAGTIFEALYALTKYI